MNRVRNILSVLVLLCAMPSQAIIFVNNSFQEVTLQNFELISGKEILLPSVIVAQGARWEKADIACFDIQRSQGNVLSCKNLNDGMRITLSDTHLKREERHNNHLWREIRNDLLSNNPSSNSRPTIHTPKTFWQRNKEKILFSMGCGVGVLGGIALSAALFMYYFKDWHVYRA